MIVHLEEGERIILSVRKHWVIFAIESLLLLLAALAPFLLIVLYQFVTLDFLPAFSPDQIQALVTFGISAWELLVFFVSSVAITNYYLDILIITNKRLVDIEQRGLFARDITTAPIEKVQDITIEVVGILAEIFGFGDMYIQTAGEQKEIMIKGIRKPHETKETILHLYHAISTKEHL
jgi:membrane protein YdbS with pleckstrin-like domain